MEIKSVGIVGAGQMGNGIAHVMSLAGYDVLLTDISQDALDSAMEIIDAQHGSPGRRADKITAQEQTEALARINTTHDPQGSGPRPI